MARSRSPERDKAFEMWRDSDGAMKLKDIAITMDKSEEQIRKWKNQDKWSDGLKGNVTESKGNVAKPKENVTKKPGPPFGSKNALGHGAPRGNKNALGNKGGPPKGSKNALKTGEYETTWYDCLTDEEQELFSKIDTTTMAQVKEGIVFFAFRERRMMERIRKLMDGLTEKQRRIVQERQVTKESVTINDDQTGETRTVMVPVPSLVVKSIEETECRKIEDILRLEDALTRVQEKKIRLLALKHSLESDGEDNVASAEEHADRVREAWAKR